MSQIPSACKPIAKTQFKGKFKDFASRGMVKSAFYSSRAWLPAVVHQGAIGKMLHQGAGQAHLLVVGKGVGTSILAS